MHCAAVQRIISTGSPARLVEFRRTAAPCSLDRGSLGSCGTGAQRDSAQCRCARLSSGPALSNLSYRSSAPDPILPRSLSSCGPPRKGVPGRRSIKRLPPFSISSRSIRGTVWSPPGAAIVARDRRPQDGRSADEFMQTSQRPPSASCCGLCTFPCRHRRRRTPRAATEATPPREPQHNRMAHVCSFTRSQTRSAASRRRRAS